MADIERLATQASSALGTTLRRLGSLALGTAVIGAIIGLATFATGLWVFDGSRTAWIVIGGALCIIPPAAAVIGWFMVSRTAKHAPQLLTDVRSLLHTGSSAATALIDHDSGQNLNVTVRSFGALRTELNQRRKDLPALWAGVRAITSVPGLAAVAVLGMLAVGALGTVLLIAGLID